MSDHNDFILGMTDGTYCKEPQTDNEEYLAGYQRGYEIAQQMDKETANENYFQSA